MIPQFSIRQGTATANALQHVDSVDTTPSMTSNPLDGDLPPMNPSLASVEGDELGYDMSRTDGKRFVSTSISL